MKRLLILIFVLLSPAAVAQENLVAKCEAITAAFFVKASVEPNVVQDFSELDPPRVRLSLPPVVPGLATDIVAECWFDDAGALDKFCFVGCYDGKQSDDRFDPDVMEPYKFEELLLAF